MNHRKASQISVGVVFVTVGGIFLGQRLGWGPSWSFAQLWPLLVIAMGLVQLSSSGDCDRRHGYFWVFVGVLFLLDRLGVLAIRDSWPLFLVMAGIHLVLNRRLACQRRKEVHDGQR